jgi:anti-sigma factor ChrR (cupin superfamily)
MKKTREAGGLAMNELYVNADELEWTEAEGYPPGAMQKVLHKGNGSMPLSLLLKIPPGWHMEEHAHVHTEIHYVIHGEYESKDKVYSSGSFRVIPAHTNHGPFATVRGAVVLVMGIQGL